MCHRLLFVSLVLLYPGSILWPQSIPVRIGSALAAPDAYRLPDGSLAGFYVEAFREAARREGVDVTWAFFNSSADDAIDSGQFDLIAGVFPSPERRLRMYLTEPWWNVPTYFVVRADSPVHSVADLRNRTAVYSASPPLPGPVSKLLPEIQFRELRLPADRLTAVCDATASAALLTQPSLHPFLTQRPPLCTNVSLRLLPQNDIEMNLSVASPFPQSALADRFRARLRQMAADGALGALARKHQVNPLPHDAFALPAPWAPPVFAVTAVASLLLSLLAWTLFRLRASRLQALHAARAKEEFFSMMSHEIRTPMNAALGYMDLLLESPLQTEQRRFVEDIGRATTSLLTVLSGIMDYSKLRSESPVALANPFLLAPLIDEVIATLSLQADAKGLDLLIDVDSSVPVQLLGDPIRLRQVLINLLANATKFTDAGYVRLAISFRSQLEITVTDSGIGISPAQQANVFEPFAQVDSSDVRRYGGVGLGLAIVRSLVVDNMKGSIRLESRLGFGSQFLVSLPFRRAQDSPGWLSELAAPTRGQLVVVAQESANATLFAGYFRQVGWEIFLFPDAVTAQQGPPLRSGWWLAVDPAATSDLAALATWANTNGAQRTLLLGTLSSLRLVPEAVRALYPATVPWPVTPSALRRLFTAETTLPPVDLAPVPSTSLPVLVVDDNPINRKLAGAMLSRLGCTVEFAENGRIALEKCSLSRYSLILMDCQMPVMDGYESAQRIRALPGQHIPIYGVSASTDDETNRRCLESGMDGYAPKPISLQSLRVLLTAAPPRSAPASLPPAATP